MLEVLDRRKPQEEEMWNDRRVHGLVGDKEETNECLVHENLATDKKQCDKGGEFGVTSLKYHQRQELGWSEGKSNLKCWKRFVTVIRQEILVRVSARR